MQKKCIFCLFFKSWSQNKTRAILPRTEVSKKGVYLILFFIFCCFSSSKRDHGLLGHPLYQNKKIKYQIIPLERVSYQQQNKRCHIRSIGINTCFGTCIKLQTLYRIKASIEFRKLWFWDHFWGVPNFSCLSQKNSSRILTEGPTAILRPFSESIQLKQFKIIHSKYL